MEEVSGIPGALPPLAPYRTATNLAPEEWQACLDSWLMSIEVRLRLQDDHFSKLSFSQTASGVPFLLTYFRNHSKHSPLETKPEEVMLHKYSYLMTKRLLLSTPISNMLKPYDMVDFILEANATFDNISEWGRTLENSGFVKSSQFESGMVAWKTTLCSRHSKGGTVIVVDALKKMNLLIKLLPKAGCELMKGADYIENLLSLYLNEDKDLQAVLTEHVYRTLLSLVFPRRVSTSMLIDQLYLIQSDSERAQKSNAHQQTLCTSLMCETNFLRHLSKEAGVVDSQRGRGLVDSLLHYREQTKHLHPQLSSRRRTTSKGKRKATGREEMHMHKAAQISQVHELFPDLSTAYVLRLLDHFHNNTEQVIAALLEPDSLPPLLQDQIADQEISAAVAAPPDLAPRSTPPLLPQRKNVFGDDEFDNLRISSKNLHRGRKELTKSEPATAEEHNKSKAAIMAALAVFDSDDDERDDTYDVADVGGSVDQSVDTDRKQSRHGGQDVHEETLFRAWKDNPSLFARDSKTRVSNVRQQLKRETGMTDEQFEGWAIMLSKDQKKQERLEKRYSTAATFRGNQKGLAQSKWQQTTSTENSHDEGDDTGDEPKSANDGRRMGQAQIRGHRDWGSGTGGHSGGNAGPSNAALSQAAQNRQEHSKQHGGYRGGRGGRNNRRDGRAKKVARGGFGGVANQ